MKNYRSYTETGTRSERRLPARTVSLFGGIILLAGAAGCGNNSVGDTHSGPGQTDGTQSTANQPSTSIQQQRVPREQINVNVCQFVTNDRVEKAMGWPAHTISGNTCDDGKGSNVPLPSGAVPTLGQATWLVTEGVATAAIYDRSFIDASQEYAKNNHSQLDTSTSTFTVNGHSGRWYPVLGVAEEVVTIGGNEFFLDTSCNSHDPEYNDVQVTQAFASNVADDFIAANHG